MSGDNSTEPTELTGGESPREFRLVLRVLSGFLLALVGVRIAYLAWSNPHLPLERPDYLAAQIGFYALLFVPLPLAAALVGYLLRLRRLRLLVASWLATIGMFGVAYSYHVAHRYDVPKPHLEYLGGIALAAAVCIASAIRPNWLALLAGITTTGFCVALSAYLDLAYRHADFGSDHANALILLFIVGPATLPRPTIAWLLRSRTGIS